MTKINTGGPAFPGDDIVNNGPRPPLRVKTKGMTLRDYFAGQIIGGLCADPSNHKTFADETDAAQSAYVIADAMIAARD